MTTDKKPFFEAEFSAQLAEFNKDVDHTYATGPAEFVLLGAEAIKEFYKDDDYTCAPYSVLLLKRLFQIVGDPVPPHIAESIVRTETINIAEIDRLADKCRMKLGLV